MFSSLILASQSKARREMLEKAGLHFSIIPAHLNEITIIDKLKKQKLKSSEIALALSKEKALNISKKHPKALVIGSDQVLEFKGKIITKSQNKKEAREKLIMLRGSSHQLLSAITISKDKNILWQYIDTATLNMHNFSDMFLDQYCAHADQTLIHSVGGYELENYGAWLFSSIQGDYFTILGMPLLPLLQYLQEQHGFKP